MKIEKIDPSEMPPIRRGRPITNPAVIATLGLEVGQVIRITGIEGNIEMLRNLARMAAKQRGFTVRTRTADGVLYVERLS